MNKTEWVETYVSFLRLSQNRLPNSEAPNFLKLFNIKKNLTPSRLYRYDALPSEDENRALRHSKLNAIKFSQLWLSNPQCFNDPYDCLMAVKSSGWIVPESEIKKAESMFGVNFQKTDDRVSIEKYTEAMLALIEEKHGPSTRGAFSEALNEVVCDQAVDLSEVSAQFQSLNLVACFTEKYDNLAMWAHYGKNNTGYCLEYDVFQNNTDGDWKVEWANQIYPVIYSTNRPNISNEASEGTSIYYQTRLTKSKHWEYEAEWRYLPPFPYSNITEVEENGRLVIAPKLTAAYVGTNISDSDLEQILIVCSFQEIPVFQMRPDHETYSFYPELIKNFSE